MSDGELTVWCAIALVFVLFQGSATIVLLSRLVKGPTRRRPVTPKKATGDQLGKVSVIIPTLNEADRIAPCLEGITKQGYELREAIVVDSRSTDNTQGLVKTQAATDPRFRLMEDDPLPENWVGRPWALHSGYLASSENSQWVLGIDADTQPQPGMISAILAAAEAEDYDLVSFAPQFILKDPGELILQPALLMTLVYRYGPSGANPDGPDRVMANGQCFLVKRSCLDAVEGYTCASDSFCDDVTLARKIASQGYKVGFLDGAKVIKVRMYEGAKETWTEWGRSLDLKDAATPAQVWSDVAFLSAVQGLPLPMAIALEIARLQSDLPLWDTLPLQILFWLNVSLVAIRFALNAAILGSYDLQGGLWSWLFFLSPLADPLAALRIALSSSRVPTQWRGRQYSTTNPTT
ncbi:MAG: 2'-O-glycosyltransferase CruG [Cyanobacteria bacterium P01_C01_bin.89]